MKNGIIMIMTNKDEEGVDSVVSFLQDLGQKYIRINTGSFLQEENDLSIVHAKNGLTISSEKTGFNIDVSTVKSVWYRRSKVPHPSGGQGRRSGCREEFLRGEWA